MNNTNMAIPGVHCYNCGKTFYPLGQNPIMVPPYGDFVCPYCKTSNRVYYDTELQREVARRDLNLDKDSALEQRIVTLEKSNEALEKAIALLNGQIAELQTALTKIISPEYRQKVASEIVTLLTQIKTEAPKEMYRG
jgi:hypothetical protein